MEDAALPDGGEAERDILPRDLPLPPPNPDGVRPTPEEMVARSIAPVKAQYICTPPPRPRVAPDAGNGADGVGEDKAASAPLSVVNVKKSKRQLKRERKQEKGSVLNICPHIAKSGNVDACRFGSNCRFNHDLGAFLAQKPADLEGICPFLSFEKPCPYGVSCRFFNTHKKSDSLETKDPSTKSSEINNLKKEVQKLLWKNKFKFPKADAELKLRGLMGPNSAKEKPEDNQAESHLTRCLNGSNTLHADSDSEIPCSAADGMECAPTVCLDKEFSDVAHVVEELRPSKKAKDQADEELCCNETDDARAGISRMEKDFEELNAQDGLEENIIDSSCLSESELILKPHTRERKFIDFRGKLYLAPLTTVGNLPFRRICKVLGADITCGEMAMCTNLLQGQASEWALLRRHSSEDLFGVQICGAYPDTITRTAELIDQECTVDFIDINMGCPIDIVVNKGAGSSLLTKPMRIKNIAQAASSTISKPITLKVRTGYFEGRNRIDSLISDISYWGVSALTIHGRSRQQRYSKLADWDYIYQCAKKAPDVMQILGNGDIFSYDDWNKHTSECPELSSCMIARGALIKPWLFTEIKEQRHWDISSCERLNIFKDYVNFGLEHWGSDTKGVETTRHFLLEWLSYAHRYVPVGLLEVIPQRINWRSPGYVGRDDLETLMASDSAADWVRISELLLGKVPEGFTFAPKHKSNAYDRTENG